MMSSAYFISSELELTGLMSFTMMENRLGPRTVPCGTPLFIEELCYNTIHHDSLLAVTQEADHPVDDIWVNVIGL